MILQGHILDKLPEIDAESVHCVVTSPPYWGLRDYGLEPQVWDGVEGCGHEWGEEPIVTQTPHTGLKNIADKCAPRKNQRKTNRGDDGDYAMEASQGQFCQNCNAWRGSLGLEPTPELHLQHMVEVFREVWWVMRPDATCWLNMGDSYASDNKWGGSTSGKHVSQLHGGDLPTRRRKHTGLKPKDLCGIPWRLALALQADGWWLRSDIIWAKSNPMPESCTDRPTSSHEYIFLLTKSGTSTYWTHRDKGGTRKRPKPDYRWVHEETGKEVHEEPANWRDKDSPWKRINLWRGHDYFYDAEAVREPGSAPTKMPDGWDTGDGAHGTIHRQGREKGDPTPKQDTLGKNTYTGFNERYAENPVAGRNLRSVWNIATQPFPGAHFATFPEALVQRCIMAGTSEKGACLCGAPWERVMEKKFVPQQDVSQNKGIRGHDGQKPMDASSGLQGTPRGNSDTKTTGWRPTCECAGEPVPSVVLDPFIGSGTVGKVAQALGRDWIGIELSPDYCAMAEKRTRHRQELLRLG